MKVEPEKKTKVPGKIQNRQFVARTKSGRRAALSSLQVNDVRMMLHQGYRHDAIAKELDISKGTISRINTGQGYSDVPGPHNPLGIRE